MAGETAQDSRRRIEGAGHGLERGTAAHPGLPVRVLAGAEVHAVVGMDGARAQFFKGGGDLRLRARRHPAIPFDRFADGAGPGLGLGHALAATLAAEVMSEEEQ